MTEAAAKTALGEVCREISFAFQCGFDEDMSKYPASKAHVSELAWKLHRRWANAKLCAECKQRAFYVDANINALVHHLQAEKLLGITFANELKRAHEALKKARVTK